MGAEIWAVLKYSIVGHLAKPIFKKVYVKKWISVKIQKADISKLVTIGHF